MNLLELNEDTFLLYAMQHYDNPHCKNLEEFKSDLNHIKYLKRLFKRYKDNKNLEDLRIRLVLNHLIIFYNVFKAEAATRILFYKVEEDLWYILNTFLLYLGYLPEEKVGLIDMDIANELRQI